MAERPLTWRAVSAASGGCENASRFSSIRSTEASRRTIYPAVGYLPIMSRTGQIVASVGGILPSLTSRETIFSRDERPCYAKKRNPAARPGLLILCELGEFPQLAGSRQIAAKLAANSHSPESPPLHCLSVQRRSSLGSLTRALLASRRFHTCSGVHEPALFRGTIERSSECILCSDVKSIGVPTLWLMDHCPIGSTKEP